ncbi:Methylthioribose-1-phosphate isomerase [Phycisphaerae bacterium RAS1]|nr:Methylthioribose-1-phosphate isomerase [Phycisphaerae bacterium RAS1]
MRRSRGPRRTTPVPCSLFPSSLIVYNPRMPSVGTLSASPAPSLAGLPATLRWDGGPAGCLRLLDQTELPLRTVYLDCRTAEQVHEAIRMLRVRGAPAIGVAAAYGLCLGAGTVRAATLSDWVASVESVAGFLRAARPTAVNLAWALDRMLRRARQAAHEARTASEAWEHLLAEADRMAEEDAAACRRIGELGAGLIPDGGGVLTHCNAGALATVAWGTALAPLYVAHERGRRFRIYADETRPLLQGARLTAYELAAAGLDVTVLCDNAAAQLMRSGAVQLVIVGADRIAANGDTANKIGTYGLALAARHHKIPFYVAAPTSTFDLALADGQGIPIEQRNAQEVSEGFGVRTVPAGVKCLNPAFDVTPAALITGILTENGVLKPVTEEKIAEKVGFRGCNGC